MNNLIFVIVVVMTLAFAEAVYFYVRYLAERRSEDLKRRLRLVGKASTGIQILRRRRLARSEWLNDLLTGVPGAERLERLLEQTDLTLTVAQLAFYTVGLFCAGAACGVWVLRSVPSATVLALFFASIPAILVFNARTKRASLVSEQLPDALDMLARSIKAGHALSSSFKLVAQECPAPVATEFAKAFEQQNLGLSLDQAVLKMTERVPSNLDLKLFAVSVTIQRETGGNLVEILENIANTMRERFKFYSKLRALTAEGRISAIVLGSLPFVVAGLVMMTNPSYLSELTHGLGQTVLMGGIVAWLLGMAWIKVLLRVEY